MYSIAFRAFLAALSFCLVSTAVSAATKDGLRINTKSEGNRPLSGVAVTVEGRDGSIEQFSTDQTGTVLANGLKPGLYRVRASHSGFTSVEEPAVRVIRGKTVPLEFVLLANKGELIEEVVVVAEATRRDVFGSVANSYLSREQLRSAPGSGSDVLRALDGLPGLFSTGEFASFTVRGNGPKDNLILVDQFPYDDVVHFNRSLGELDDINGGGRYSIFAPNLIEGAEYSPGGWQSAFGGRRGSLLNLNVARGNPSPSASLRLDMAGVEVTYDGPSGFHDDTSLLLSARQFDFGRLFDFLGENDNGSPVMTDIILKSHTTLNPNNELEILVLHNPETQERTVENVLAAEQLDDRTLFNAERDSTLLGLTWTRLFGVDGRWANRLYYRDSDKVASEGEAFPFSTPEYLPPEDVPVWEDIITRNEREQEFGWRSDIEHSNRLGSFAAGLRLANASLDYATTLEDDWIRYEYDGRDSLADPDNRYVVLTPEAINSEFSRTELQYAVYAEQIVEQARWSLRAGLRYDYDGFSDKGYVSPRLSATYQLRPATTLSATAGIFHQSPRYLDRAADPANFGLENEQLDHVSLGFRQQLGSQWSFLTEVYYQSLSNLVTEPDQATGQVSNRGKGSSYGVDLVLNRYFNNGWSGDIVYSYNDATRDDRDGNGEYAADFNRKHMFSTGLQWEISKRWQLGLRWKYATGRPRNEFVVHEDVLSDIGGPLRYSREYVTRNTERWDAYHTLNARVDYRRTIGPVDLIAFLDVLNLYGSAATDELDFDPATGELIEDDGDILPLIGIRFEKTW